MLKLLTWIVILTVGLFVGGVIAVLAGGEERRSAVRDGIRGSVLELSDDGKGYHDGRLVHRAEVPFRITIEEMDTIEGKLRGSRFESGFLTARMSWFGISLRDALARVLDLPSRHVVGHPSLDERWLDIDAGRAGGVFGGGAFDWDEAHEPILEGLLEGYDLTVAVEPQRRELVVITAGDGFARSLDRDRRRRGSRQESGPGHLRVRGSLQGFLNALRSELAYDRAEGFDDLEGSVDLELSWDADDPDGFRRALAEACDVHVRHIEDDVPVAIVQGVPKPVFER